MVVTKLFFLPKLIAETNCIFATLIFFKPRSDHCHTFSINHRVTLCQSIFVPVFWEGEGWGVGWVVGLQLDDDTHKRRSNQSVPRRPWYGEACFLLPGRILDLIFVILKPVFGLLLQCRSFIAPTVSDSYKRRKVWKILLGTKKSQRKSKILKMCSSTLEDGAHFRFRPLKYSSC